MNTIQGDNTTMRLGVQIRRENGSDYGHNYVQIQTNDYEKIEDALEDQLGVDCGRWGFEATTDHKIKYVLRELFDNHSEFYDYFGFDAGVQHGPTGQDFNTEGWRQFNQDAFNQRYADNITDEEDLQLFTNVIAEKLRDALEDYDDELLDDGDNFVAKSSVSVDAEPSGTLTDPEMLDEAVVVTEEGAKKLQVQDIEGAETLDDVKHKVEEETKTVYENQVQTRLQVLKEENQHLKDKIESERKQMLVKGIELVGNLDNWEVEGNYLVYQGTVNMETVKKDKQSNPRELTEEAQEKFYIEKPKVKIRKQITTVRFDDAFHPHALGYGTCTGNFEAPMGEDGLNAIIDQLKHGDLHTTSHTDAERELKDNWEEYIKTEENEDGEEEEVTEEVWTAE